MDKRLGNLGWNELTPDEQELIGYTMPEAAKLHPGWLTQEKLDSIARFVRFTQQRKAPRRSTEEDTK